MLNFETRKVVNVGDLNRLVKETYGIPYSFQQQDGCKDRSCSEWFEVPMSQDEVEEYNFEATKIPEIVNDDEMGVSFKSWLERDPTKPLNSPNEWDVKHGLVMWYERNFYPALEPLVQDLYEKGLIESGTYYINIDW